MRYRYRLIQNVILYVMILLVSMLITENKNTANNPKHFINLYKQKDFLELMIDEVPTEKPKSYKAICKVKSVIRKHKAFNANGKLLIYFKKDAVAGNLKYGDVIIINKISSAIKNSGNPGEFDNKRYLAFQNVYHQAYLTEHDFIVTNKNEGERLWKFIFSLQDFTLRNLKFNFKDKEVLGIAEALLIGYKNDLDRDVVQTYSNTGVVHIIAISGLHLGLIYMVLLWLFNRLPIVRNQRLIKSVLLITCLWIFSLMAGASASVLRSAVMFTCIITGNVFERKSGIYNSLAASAFLLLCYNPYFLWDIGFQLSYLAIIGIVWLQKPVQSVIYYKSSMARKIWEMTSITIAAQIITFPVSLYYFHQFPNLFLITNLIAVPLSTFILFGEIALITFSSLSFISKFIALVCTQSIMLLNKLISFIDNIPFSKTENIDVNFISTILLYIFLIVFSLAIIHRNKIKLAYAFLFFTFFCANQSFASIRRLQQNKLIVYNIPHQQSIHFIYKHNYVYCGDSIKNNMALLAARKYFMLNPTGSSKNIYNNRNMIIDFCGIKIGIVNKKLNHNITSNEIQTEFVLISNNAAADMKEITSSFRTKLIVFDATNSLWKIAQWKKQCEALHLRCYSIPDIGAFVYNLDS